MLLECPKFLAARGKFNIEVGVYKLTVENFIKNSNKVYLQNIILHSEVCQYICKVAIAFNLHPVPIGPC